MSKEPNYVGDFRRNPVTFSAADGTRPKRIWTPAVPPARKAAGETILRGSRLHALLCTSKSAAAYVFQLHTSKVRTCQDATKTGALQFSGSTITRATGKWADDGWQVGEQVWVEDVTSPGNGSVNTITSLTATGDGKTMTVATAWGVSGEALPAGARIHVVIPLNKFSVGINQGTLTTNTPLNVLHNSYLPHVMDQPDAMEVLGPDDVLLASVDGGAMTAGHYVYLAPIGGDF